MNAPARGPTDLKRLLGEEQDAKARWRWPLVAVVALLLAGAVLAVGGRRGERPVEYRTEAVSRGDLTVTVSATGKVQPTNKVEVSSELSGIIIEVLVDDNDRVTAGQVLARLDTSKLEDAVARTRAALAVAEAQVQQAAATVAEARATVDRYERVSELSGGRVPSRAEMSTAEASLLRAQANATAAGASVVQARAELQSNRTDLTKASIRSPIDGVVLIRAVEPGQTVAAALSAPVLFTLAEDLAQMELRVSIDEADVGRVEVGQRASFTVDAWPGRHYEGVITRVAFGAEEANGVVSYPTVLAVQNEDSSLRPGMTATANIVTIRREGVLRIPNAALRFSLSTETQRPGPEPGGVIGRILPRPPMRSKAPPAGPTRSGATQVWARGADARLTRVEVRTGVSDGRFTELLDGALSENDELVVERVGDQP